jgi:hypothetical protein
MCVCFVSISILSRPINILNFIHLLYYLSLSLKQKNENDCWCCAAGNFNFFFLLIMISHSMYVPESISHALFTCILICYTYSWKRQKKKERKKESAKAIKRNSYSISIHMSFLLSQHLARLFFYCCLFLFHTMWCRYHSLRSNHNIDNRSRHVGVVSLYLLLSFNIDSLSFI